MELVDGKRRSKRLRNQSESKAVEDIPETPVIDIEDKQGKLFKIPYVNSTQLDKHDEIIDWAEFVSATQTKNFILRDGFLDTLNFKSSAIIKSDPSLSSEVAKAISLKHNTTNFIATVLQQGNLFENKVIALLQKELGPQNFKNIGGNTNARSTQKYRDTLAAMKAGVPVITQGIVRNYKNKTYGVPDILIRSDWINKFVDINALQPNEIHVRAPGLSNPFENSRSKKSNTRNKNTTKAQNYHYIVIDIKCKVLTLRADGVHLRNDSILKAYKSQLWIYNEALGEMQGFIPEYAFLLGSKYKYTCGGIPHESSSCFGKLARIDYANIDSIYIKLTADAVEWLNILREEGDTWDLSAYPLPRKELYPNMCNRYDYPYHHIKKAFAEKHNDLTLLRNVGPKQRDIAFANGVYTWDDERCSAETLGVKGKVTSKILTRILEVNQNETHNIIPKYIKNNFKNWKDELKIELFVDFEMSCSVFQEFEDLPHNRSTNLIFLIGAGYIDPKTKEWVFIKFVADRLTQNEERRICSEFANFVQMLARKYKVKNIPCYHWSPAEPSCWRRATSKINRGNFLINWVDLLKVFTSESIGIKGCLNYSLKTVSAAMYNFGYINTIWHDTNCADGADAAVNAYRANNECVLTNEKLSEHPIMLDIAKYNEVDCRVVQEILYYLRENHISDDESDEEDEITESEEEVKRRKIISIEDISESE